MASSMITTTLFFASAVSLLLSTPSSAQFNHLLNEQRLSPGDSLVQSRTRLTMQNDCNLVLFDNAIPIWTSGTKGRGSGCYAILQNDGNFVIYNNTNHAVWGSNTGFMETEQHILVLQRDRNVVLYFNVNWATNTSRSGANPVIIASSLNGTNPVIIASPLNGTVGITGAQQNNVGELLNAEK